VRCSKKVLAIAIILAGVVTLSFFNPEKTIWLPKCPFYLLTGFQCPACGTQRALYHLLHFNMHKAFCYNPFLVISMPYALLLIAVTWFDPKGKLKKLKKICYSPIIIKTYLVLIIGWWIIRNIIQL
jgi:hypothetical protein